MKSSKERVLIAGISGFIGAALRQHLQDKGFEVWGISRRVGRDERTVAVDLLSYSSLERGLKCIPPCSVVVHSAAIAHKKDLPRGEEGYFEVNERITKHLVSAIEPLQPSLVFLSSISVYGEDGRDDFTGTNLELRPSSDYGASKLRCEELVTSSKLSRWKILRLGPVFSETNRTDIRKRVYLPGQQFLKLVIKPSPKYSLCSIETAVSSVCSAITEDGEAKNVCNVVDPVPYYQNDIVKWFEGLGLVIPVLTTIPFYYLTYLLPKVRGYQLRCLYWKLFRNNLYQ